VNGTVRTQRLLRGAGLILLCLAVAAAAPRTAAAQSADGYTGRIVDIAPTADKLKVKLRGQDETNATLDMLVGRMHLLRLAPDGKATIRCLDDGRLLPLQTGRQGVPCTKPVFENSSGGSVRRPRGADSLSSPFPVIISPRATLLLGTRPTLRWSPVTTPAPGMPEDSTPSYTVGIYTDDMMPVWTKAGVTQTELAYPADKPELGPGEYLLVISTSVGASSDQEKGAGWGFTVLPKCAGAPPPSPCVERDVRQGEEKIRALSLSDDAKRLLVIDLYAEHELYAEAIEQLERLTKTVSASALLRRLGDLYTRVGLNREAAKRYASAAELAQEAKDAEGRALALQALAQAYQDLGSFVEALATLDAAADAFEKLGDLKTAAELRKTAAEIRKRRGTLTPPTRPR
jgi:hypothetical protein